MLRLLALFIRDLLLNPPSYEIASSIQSKSNASLFPPNNGPAYLACRLMSSVTCSIPEFTCVSAAKVIFYMFPCKCIIVLV
ncbi:hypothetical protein GW17_00040507 [Ensete ventricosum]|nr:hypothetical protein GW17_00040507 [Ensete ventricosum]